MTKQEFWEMLEENMPDCDEIICPVKRYSIENNVEQFCDEFGNCADALKKLAWILESEEDGRE